MKAEELSTGKRLDVPWYTKCIGGNRKLVLYTGLLLLSSVGNQLFFKRMTSAMPNYCFFLSMLSTVFYLPVFGLLSGRGVIKEAKLSSMKRFAIMGMFDGFAGVLMILGGSHTSGTNQVLLSQAVIPCTVLAAIVLLSKRFHLLQYAGAAAIVMGIVLAKVGAKADPGGAADIALFNGIFLLASVPTALSSTYKEVAFRGFDDLDVNVLQFWVAIFQTMVCLFTMPVYSLSMLGASQVPMKEMWSQSFDGAQCLFFLQDSVVTDCGLAGQRACDTCQDAFFPVAVYFTFNMLYNIFTMLVIKHGSATLSFLVATLRMPLSSIAFASKTIMGKDAATPTLSDLICLVVIISGLGAYRAGGKQLKRQLEKESSAALSSPSTWLLSDSPAPQASPGGTLTRRASEMGWKFVPMFMAGVNAQPVYLYAPEAMPSPKSNRRIRTDLIHKLGAASPLQSPKLRGMMAPMVTAVSPVGAESDDAISPEIKEFDLAGFKSPPIIDPRQKA